MALNFNFASFVYTEFANNKEKDPFSKTNKNKERDPSKLEAVFE
jgi:hypothetical protein